MADDSYISKIDLLHYRALKTAVQKGEADVSVSMTSFNRPGSPVYNPWENIMPLIVPVTFGLGVMIFAGLLWGIIIITASVLAYAFFFKEKIGEKVRERVIKRITGGYKSFVHIFRYDGIYITLKDNSRFGTRSPNGNWKGFAALNFSDYMLEEENPALPPPEEKNDETEESQTAEKPAERDRKTGEPEEELPRARRSKRQKEE